MPSRIGALAGRFVLTRLLGEDAAGATFEGLDSAQDRPVLIKLLPKALAADPARQEQLQRLVERLTELDHPNLLSVLESGIQEGTPYLIAQAVVATPLAQKMGQALDVEQVASIISQAGEALIHAYRQGMSHGRLSPQNVLLTAAGQVLLSDLGLESVLETPWEKVQSELAAYLAPERLKGWQPDARADVYALGVMLFEMLTGLRLDGSAEKALSWLHEVVPELAPALEPVLARALATHPEARYATVGEFMADLWPIFERYLQPQRVPRPLEPAQLAAPAPSETPELLPVPPPTLIVPALEGIPAIPMPEPPPMPTFDWEAFSQSVVRLPLPVPLPIPKPLPLPQITAEGIEFPTVSPIVFEESGWLAEGESPQVPLTAEPPLVPSPTKPPARTRRRARQQATPIGQPRESTKAPMQSVSRSQPPATRPLRIGRLVRAILVIAAVLLLLTLSCCAWLFLSAEVGERGGLPACYRAPEDILLCETWLSLPQGCQHGWMLFRG